MAGLVPAIHVFLLRYNQDVDARHKAGHDDFDINAAGLEQESTDPVRSAPPGSD
jgi:hypothetical protein